MARRTTHDTPLLRILAAAGWNQASLAKRLQVERQQIHMWFVKGRPIPPAWAERIAPIIGVNPSVLVFGPKSGLAETSPDLDEPTAVPTVTDDQVGIIQEAVAAMLEAEHLPRTQADIARVSRIAERDMIATGRLRNFDEGLALTLSEIASRLKRKWAEALATK